MMWLLVLGVLGAMGASHLLGVAAEKRARRRHLQSFATAPTMSEREHRYHSSNQWGR